MEFLENTPGANDPAGQWMKWVNSETPLTADEQAAVDCYRVKFPKEKRQLRAFWHEGYGQFWIYERGYSERQIGCVFADQIEKRRAA